MMLPGPDTFSLVPGWVLLAVAAPFFGSFLGLLATRLPEGRPVLWGRSRCEGCGTALAPLHLVPLLSWVGLRGRCRYCGVRLGLFHPAIELAALLAVLWAATIFSGPLLATTCLYGWLLLALAFADAKTGLLPDILNLALLVSGLGFAALFDLAALPDRLIGAALGFVLLAAMRAAYRALRGRDGLGLGDAKLLGAMGAWVAWQGLATLVVFASVLGLAYVLLQSAIGRPLRPQDRLAFGPFLAAAGWLVWLYGPLAPV